MLKRRSISNSRISSRKGAATVPTATPAMQNASIAHQHQVAHPAQQLPQTGEVFTDLQRLLSKLSSTGTVVPLSSSSSPSPVPNALPPPADPSVKHLSPPANGYAPHPHPQPPPPNKQTLSELQPDEPSTSRFLPTREATVMSTASLDASGTGKMHPRSHTANDIAHSSPSLPHNPPPVTPTASPRASARLTVRVPRSSLRNASGNGLAKRTAGGLFASSSVTVSVQPSSEGRHDSVFYAPFPQINSTGSPALVDFLHVDSSISPSSVTTAHSFDVSFVGAYLPAGDYNPFVLYSVRPPSEADHPQGHREPEDSAAVLGLKTGEAPVVHFNKSGKLAHGRFMAVPTSTAVSVSRTGSGSPDAGDCVSLRFSLRKADDSMGGCVLVEKDVAFRLAPSPSTSNGSTTPSPPPSSSAPHHRNNAASPFTHHGETFLQYGYYFFLRDDIDAQLYAQTEASAQAVPLLLRRHPYDARMAQRGEKEYFPLTGVPYVVVRVSAAGEATHNPNTGQETAAGNRVWLSDVLCAQQSRIGRRRKTVAEAPMYRDDGDRGIGSGALGDRHARQSKASSEKRSKRKSMSSPLNRKKKADK